VKFKRFFLHNWPIFVIFFLVFVFFWKFFLRGLIPIPADVIVGIYYPWRDYTWGGLVTGIPVRNGLLSDVISIIYPWRIYGIELLKKGIWPLWIPHALAGAPLLANFQSGLLYPFNFLFFIFSNEVAWSFYIILQPILASIFCFLFLKNLRLKNLPALIGSLIFAFGGFSSVWLEYGIIGHSGLWLPLILLSVNKLISKFSFLWVIIGSLAICFSFLAGYPQISIFTLVLTILYASYRIFFFKKKKKIKTISLFFPVLGVMLAAIQLLPGIELWSLSLRQVDPTAAAFDFGLNPFKNLILFLAPDFYGNPVTGNFWGWGAYNEAVPYVSVVGLILALIALINVKENKNLIFFKFLMTLSLIFVFKNPISIFIFNLHLPVLASSSAARFFFLTQFSLAILAAFGAQFLMKSERKNRSFVFSLIWIALPVLLIITIVFLKPEIWPDKNLLSNLKIAQRNLILPTALFCISFVLVFITYFKLFLSLKRLILFFLFFLTVFDLFRFGLKYNPFSKREYLYPQTDLTKFLQAQEGLYRFSGLIPQSIFIPYNLSSPEGYEPMMIRRYSEFAGRINEQKFSQISTGSRWIIVNRHDSPLLNLLGTKYFLFFNAEPQSNWDPQYYKYSPDKYKLVFQYGKSQIYENKRVLPRAFLVHDFQVLVSEKILKKLMDDNFNPTRTLLLEQKPEKLPGEKKGEEEVIIDVNAYFQNKIIIQAKVSNDAFLFISDNYYPGWRAYVDNKETKIYRANYTFRAIALPAGSHVVKFVYDPLSFKIGKCVSLVSFLFLIFMTIFSHKLPLFKRKIK